MAELCKPDSLHWVDGSKEEYDELCKMMVESGTFIKLNEELWPGCYYARSDPSDVARVEDRTFICSLSKEARGPDEQLDESVRDAPEAAGDIRRLCAGAPCTCCPSAWGRSARRWRRSGSSSRIPLMSSSTCGSWPGSACRCTRRSTRGRSGLSRACTRWVRRSKGAEGRAVAVQQGEVHRPLPRDPGDLELRIRLRRQRAARQEMLRAADRLEHRARRGLDGGAHADPGRRESRRARRPT